VRRLKAWVHELPRQLGYHRGPRLMSWLRKRWVLLRHPHANVSFHPTCYLGPGFSVHIPENGTLVVGPGVEFRRGFRAEIQGSGRLTIGAGSVFTYYVLIQCSTSIEIGERCMFGQSTLVVDGNHRFRDLDRPMLEQGYDFTPIRIEDDATITTKCTIIADVGRRAFVAANTVVSKPVPAFTLVAGVPARELDYYGPASSHA
jgi:acetyltransferase-like isoleucine patch superfamily enzyme